LLLLKCENIHIFNVTKTTFNSYNCYLQTHCDCDCFLELG